MSGMELDALVQKLPAKEQAFVWTAIDRILENAFDHAAIEKSKGEGDFVELDLDSLWAQAGGR